MLYRDLRGYLSSLQHITMLHRSRNYAHEAQPIQAQPNLKLLVNLTRIAQEIPKHK